MDFSCEQYFLNYKYLLYKCFEFKTFHDKKAQIRAVMSINGNAIFISY